MFQVPSHNRPDHHKSDQHASLHPHCLEIHSLQHALNRSPSKVAPQVWWYSSSPNRGQNHSKVTLTLGSMENNQVQQVIWQIPGLTQLKPRTTPDWPVDNIRTKPCPQWAKRAITVNWTKGKYGSAHKSRSQATPMGDTSEVPGSGEQETLSCKTLQDLLHKATT